ncbi:MAG: thiamine pyrophosphate-binding protein, partial [Alicyclobacillus macrosporangiidus]|uniref:thiamine pyrophosphate-binding protein n=1 Tax=Alicyclobacillus macrosporangiidus TaxID=392015 RepID=UPI0026EAC177
MKGRDLVLEAFHRYGVRHVFGNPGTTELPLMDGLAERSEVEYILALHEDIAVGMAAGYAQVTGRPAVVNLHVTPGLAHGLG